MSRDNQSTNAAEPLASQPATFVLYMEVQLNCERLVTMLGFGHFALYECSPFFGRSYH